MFLLQIAKWDNKFHICRGNYILHLKIRVLDIKTHLLNAASVFSACQLTILLRLRPSDHHLAATEDQPCSFGILKTHYQRWKALRVVLHWAALPADLFEV